MLTKPQYIALAKWRDGKPQNETANRVRFDVYGRLRDNKMLETKSFLLRTITDKGLAALAAYETKDKRKMEKNQ